MKSDLPKARKKAREMAKSLKEQGVAIAVIVKSSGLSEEEIDILHGLLMKMYENRNKGGCK